MGGNAGNPMGGMAGAGRAGMGGAQGGLGGVGGRGGAGGCDLGCEPSNQGPSTCNDNQTTWLCRNEADFTQFLANCEVAPTGALRFCCPTNFVPACN
jgi:hypothetical protein